MTHQAQENQMQSNKPSCHSIAQQTILIVDDEYDLVDVAAFHLEAEGYQVIKAYHDLEVFNILDRGEKIDLVFSDIVMPGSLSGFKLADKIHRMYPELKLLLTSAYIKETLDVPGNKLISDLSRTLLKKPYTKLELTEAISQALDDVAKVEAQGQQKTAPANTIERNLK